MSYVAMPPKVAGAVNAVMKAIKRLEKGEFNKHGNFKFTSVDGFFDAVRPLMADAGLIISSDEEDFDIISTEKTTWLKMRFAFILSHETGETWECAQRRTIMVNAAMGSQAFGAGQSYAEKQYLRSLFKMSTGDADADSAAPELLGRPEPKMVEPKALTLRQRADNLMRTMQEVKTQDGLDKSFKLGAKLCAELDAKDPELLAEVTAAYEARTADFDKVEA